MTRGALTTFSIANDVAKYFAILRRCLVACMRPHITPWATFFTGYHALTFSRKCHSQLHHFNALIIIALIPLALRGVLIERWKLDLFSAEILRLWIRRADCTLHRIKLLDMLIAALGVCVT